MRVRLLPASEMDAVAPFWAALEDRVGGGRLAVSWTWTSTWLWHYGDAVLPRFAVVERRDEPVGAVLLVTSRRGPRALPTRRLHLGTAGEPAGDGVFVEYNDVLCAPEDRGSVVEALVETIRQLPGWDELDAPGPAAAEALQEVLPFEERAEASWTMRLHPDRTVLEGLKGSVRRLVRQARESLEPGPPELVSGVPAARDALGELARLHQERWLAVGKPGVFASERLTGFLTDLTEAWLPAGRVLLYRLPDSSGDALGCVVGFVEDGRFLYYQAGFRQFTDNRSRAGLLCHAEFAELCRRRGMGEYELLAGDAQFKRQLSGGEFNTLIWSRYRRPSLRNGALHLARQARRAVASRPGSGP
jgi:CelD/BcsL family acetyltransferase involved in cellulose biosynthesis